MAGKKNTRSDPGLETMVRNIEQARSTGRREGVEACLRFLAQHAAGHWREDRAAVERAAKALTKEMVRRTWIEL